MSIWKKHFHHYYNKEKVEHKTPSSPGALSICLANDTGYKIYFGTCSSRSMMLEIEQGVTFTNNYLHTDYIPKQFVIEVGDKCDTY